MAYDTKRADQLDPASAPLLGSDVVRVKRGAAEDTRLRLDVLAAFVSGQASGKDSVKASTAAALPANSYAAGVLTADVNGVLPTIGAVALIVGDALLVKNEAAQLKNGIYTVTSVGSAGAPWVLTRRTDADAWEELVSAQVPVDQGTYANTVWFCSVDEGGALGTTAITFLLYQSGKTAALGALGWVADRLFYTTSTVGVALTAFTAFARTLLAAVDARAFCALLGTWWVVANSAVAASHTGNTNETTLADITIPAGAMGPNGVLRITTFWAYTNSANIKTLRVRLGGIGGTAFSAVQATTSAGYGLLTIIENVNAANSQKGGPPNYQGIGITSSALVTAAIDTTAAQSLVLTAQHSLGTETIILQSYLVEILYRA